jgi:hypothetical protein
MSASERITGPISTRTVGMDIENLAEIGTIGFIMSGGSVDSASRGALTTEVCCIRSATGK